MFGTDRKAEMWRSILVSLLFFSPPAAAAPAPAASASSSCPLNLSYVTSFPWDRTSCVHATANLTHCCTTLLSLLGVGLAARLRDTGDFRLPDVPTADACLADFAASLDALSLPSSSLLPSCFPSPADILVITPAVCAGILTEQDFVARLGNASTAALDAACAGDLSDLTRCGGCYNAGVEASTQLTEADGNSSVATSCFYLTVLYSAGVANQYGPDDPRDAACIFGLSIATESPPAHHSRSRRAAVYVSVFAALGLVLVFALLGSYLWRRRRREKERTNSGVSTPGSMSRPRPNSGSIWFGLKELEKATGYFSQRNLIGRGGFGVVYKGVLYDGSSVAVKKMLDPDVEGAEEFRNEVEIISNLRHRNLVPLRGSCITEEDMEEGQQRFLVYDYMPNGSLDDHIFTSPADGNGNSKRRRPPLTWPQRKNIILDVAKGLVYLHYGVRPAIYHRDIKATNILLDGEMRARVADFGLARESREGQSQLTTRVAGTHGYLAPEYALYGQLTEKSDVYSFGVVVLEVLSGRKALDMSAPANMVLITDWAWTLVKAGRVEEVLDAALVGGDGPRAVMERFVRVGILCAHVMVALRPTIAESLRMLEGDIELPDIPDRPLPLAHGALYGDRGAFGVSPNLSGLCLNSGEMLR